MLLLTDDGDLAHQLMHPRFAVERTYHAKVKGAIEERALERLRTGVYLEDGRARAEDVRFLRRTSDNSWITLTLREGRHHEVKRMCLAAGHPVQKLRRVSYAGVGLGGLEPGRIRRLTPPEVAQLRRAVREGVGGKPGGRSRPAPRARVVRALRRRLPPVRPRPLALVALAPLLLALEGARRPFLLGWLAGWAAFTGVVWWVYYAMAHFGGIPPFVAVPLMLLMTAVMALFWGLFGWAYARVRRTLPRVPALVAAPALWTASEYLRAQLPDLEFPWALLGNALAPQLALIQVADVGGVWAVSFLAALAGAGCAALARDPRGRGWDAGWRPFAAALAALAACAAYGGMRLAEPPASAQRAGRGRPGEHPPGREVGPELPRGELPHARGAVARGGPRRRGPGLVVRVRDGVRLPARAGVPAPLRRSRARGGTPLLFGSPAFERVGGRQSLRNRAYLIGADGEIAGWQDKQQLVPFGEFVPFARLLFFARPLVQAVGNFEPGEGPRLLGDPGRRFGALVCYEVIFPDLVRRFAAGGAAFLVNITNDAWYERSAASAQQFAHLFFRAVENRRPIARAANTGISGFVDANGRVLSASPLFVRGQWAATLPLPSRTTLYTRWGDWLPRLCALLALAALLAPRRGVQARTCAGDSDERDAPVRERRGPVALHQEVPADPATGLCAGCCRTIDEIVRWGGAGEDERRRILAAVRGARGRAATAARATGSGPEPGPGREPGAAPA